MNNTLICIIFSFLLIATSSLHAQPLPGPLIETSWLADNLAEVTVIDVRTDLKSFKTKAVYIKNKKNRKKKLIKIGGHIPGARLINYKNIRTTNNINGHKVQKMLPGKSEFEKLLQKNGINKNSKIVIISKGKNSGDVSMATRLYWQLKYYGHDNMAILNGGMAQWILDGRKISYSVTKPAKGNWQATTERKEILASTPYVSDALDNPSVQIIDNRSIDLYLGTWKKPSVISKGHIPGAKLYPNSIFTSHGFPAKFLKTDKIKSLSNSLGIDPDKEMITYCNSGHLSSGGWFLMHELLGNNNVKLYDGSMHEWALNKGNVKTMTLE